MNNKLPGTECRLAIERAERLHWAKSTCKWRGFFLNESDGCVIENGIDEMVVAAAHVGKEHNACAAGTNQVCFHVAIIGMADVKLSDIDIGDDQTGCHIERRCNGAVIDDRLGQIAGVYL